MKELDPLSNYILLEIVKEHYCRMALNGLIKKSIIQKRRRGFV
jgi:hypothetical protein